ncbi:MAG TPA: hypothetical protein VLL77_00765 [Anaerolineales bacterium]|nr:hypothetical protein [Anaerolineales bacterium]
MKSLRVALPIVLLAALAFPAVAFAAGQGAEELDGRVVLGGTYTLPSGQVLTGDLVVVGGAATLETDSRVTGNVVLLGGFVKADGTIDGDLFALGGIATLGSEAVVRGDLITMGAVVDRAEGAVVQGQVTAEAWTGFDFEGQGVMVPPQAFSMPDFPFRTVGTLSIMSPLASFGWSLLRALLMAGLAVLIVMFWPERTARVGRAVISQPVASGGFGLLTGFLAVLVIVFLAITICLIPFSVIGAVIFAAALVFGWTALGLEVGIRLSEALKREWHPATQAGLGTLLLSFVAAAFDLIPCVGGLVVLVLWLIGLGAVVLTRFGGQEAASSGPPAPIPSA